MSLKELKLKYNFNRFKKLRKDYLDSNCMDIELSMHTYIDNYHLFLEIKQDVESIMYLIQMADELFVKANPKIKHLREENDVSTTNHLYDYDSLSSDSFYPDTRVDKKKLYGLAEDYFKNFEEMIRSHFKEISIDKRLGNLNKDERKNVRYFPKKETEMKYVKNFNIGSFLDIIFSNDHKLNPINPKSFPIGKPIFDEIQQKKREEFRKQEKSAKVKLLHLYRFADLIKKFDPSVKLKLQHDISFDNQTDNPKANENIDLFKLESLMLKTVNDPDAMQMAEEIVFDRHFNDPRYDDSEWAVARAFFENRLFNIYLKELKTIHDFVEKNIDLFIKFLDYCFNPSETLKHCNGKIFVKLNFSYNIFRAKMTVEEFERESKKRKIKTTKEDVQLYEDFSKLLEDLLKAKTILGKYKWYEYKFGEKQVDGNLMLECQEKMIEKKDNDLFCIISNDSDFVPLLKKGKKYKCETFLCSVVKQRFLSRDVREIIDNSNIIFPKNFNIKKLIDCLYHNSITEFLPSHIEYIFHKKRIPRPDVIDLVVNEEARNKLLQTVKVRIENEIKVLKQLPVEFKDLSSNLSKVSERFIKYGENVSFFEKK